MPGFKACDTLYFDGSMWVCVFEREENGRLRACRVVFGAEPSDTQFLQYVNRHAGTLCFGPPVNTRDSVHPEHANPKRMKRLAAKAAKRTGISTKSQQALSLGRETAKKHREASARQHRDEERMLRRAAQIEKHRRKHRGR